VIALAAGGCAGDRASTVGDTARDARDNPFVPRSIRIFPLTRLDMDERGRAIIVCHVEMKDRWGDGVKSAGTLEVQLYRSEGASDVQESRWSVDLNDLDLNAALYDPASRTYRVQLGDLPAWVAAMAARSEQGASISAGESRLRLRAVLRLHDDGGRESVLRDDYVIQR
jgi:hypothetical protein